MVTNTTIINLFILMFIWLFYLTFIASSDRNCGTVEGYANNSVSNEALQNIASIYNNGKLTVTDLKVTGNIDVVGSITNPSVTQLINLVNKNKADYDNEKQLYIKYNDEIKINNKWASYASYLNAMGPPPHADGLGTNVMIMDSKHFHDPHHRKTSTWRIEKL